MPRKPRLTYVRAMHHVSLRCNNKEFLFTPSTQGLFLGLVQEMRTKFPIQLYNYCIMTNHVHLLFKVGHEDTLSEAMHWLGSTFSHRFNRLGERVGHLWQGRFRSTIVEESSYFFRAMAYLDLNPVRAKMVSAPIEYLWSGHRALHDEDRSLVDLHPLYLEAGRDRAERYRWYLQMLAEEAGRLAISLVGKYFVGSPRFVSQMAERFGLLGARARLKSSELGAGVLACEPSQGGNVRAK